VVVVDLPEHACGLGVVPSFRCVGHLHSATGFGGLRRAFSGALAPVRLFVRLPCLVRLSDSSHAVLAGSQSKRHICHSCISHISDEP
jgi:hypothetical protein